VFLAESGAAGGHLGDHDRMITMRPTVATAPAEQAVGRA
jgi:hypothetical protein